MAKIFWTNRAKLSSKACLFEFVDTLLGIGLTDYSTAARIYRAALGVFLVIATLGFSLCFQGFRDLFTKQTIGTIVIQPFKSRRDLLDEDNEEVSHLYIEAGFTDSNGRKKYRAAIDLKKNGITEPSGTLELDDVEIRDLISALPAEKFETYDNEYPRRLFENAIYTKIQDCIQKAIEAQ